MDPQAGTVLTDQVILIRDNKIEQVGKGLAIPADAKVIDLSQMTVLPGLIDCHTHLADAPDEDGDPFLQLKKTAAQTAFASVPNARTFLREGFTTVRDVGVYRALNDVAMRDAIAHGFIEGPRMYVAGAYITITGGAGAMTGFAPDITLPWDLRYGQANSPWEVRQRIRQLVHDGVDHIKVLSSGAVLTHGSNPKSQEFTPEELQAAVDEASHFGLRVEAHAHSPEGIKNAIRAGVASVEHATMIDDEGIALAKQHGTYLDMDIYDEECIQEAGRLGKIPKDFLQHDAELGEIQRQNFRKAVKAGREDVIRHRRRRLSLRPQRPAVRLHGEVRHDADAGHPVGHHLGRGFAGAFRCGGRHQAGQVRRRDRSYRRSVAGHQRAGACPVRDERRKGLQAVTSVILSGVSASLREALDESRRTPINR